MPTMPKTHKARTAAPVAEKGKARNERRASSRARGYDSRWDKMAKGYLRAHPLCVGCEAAGITEPAVVVDHVVPHRGDKVLFWDRHNRQGLCAWHHNAVKQKLEKEFTAGYIPAGSLRMNSDYALSVAAKIRRIK
jgi:5-methylcytosine-specific restriction protein A